MVGVPHGGARSVCGGSLVIGQGKQEDHKIDERKGDMTLAKCMIFSSIIW